MKDGVAKQDKRSCEIMEDSVSPEAGDVATVVPAPPNIEGTSQPAAWYPLFIFTLMYVANNVDRSVMSILLEPIRLEFSLADSQLGLLTGLAFALTYSLFGMPIGYLIDRVNRRNLLAGLMSVWSICTILCGMAQSFWALVLARLAVGAAESGGAPAAMSMISDLFPKKRRSFALSLFWSSTAFGTAISFVLGSIIAVEYGWRMAFFIAGVPGLILAALLVLTVKEPKRGLMDDGENDDEPSPTLIETWRFVRSRRHLVHSVLAIGFSAVMLSGVLVWAVSFFVRSYDMALTEAGMIVGLSVAVFGVAGSVLSGMLGDYVYRKWGMTQLPLLPAATTLLAALAILGMVVSPGLIPAIIAFMIFEILSRSYTAPGYNFLMSEMEPRMRGVVVSVVQGISNLVGYGLGPVLVGVVSDTTGELSYGLLAVAAVGVWVSLHFYWAHTSAVRSTAASTESMAALTTKD